MARDGLPTRNTHFRVDFVVREVCTDGSVPEEELRFVQLGDEMHRADLFDYFNRVRDAVQMLFPRLGPIVLVFDSTGGNKIQVIKVVREVTGLGLKEAKDVVEAPLGTAVMSFDDPHQAERAAKKLEAAGAKPAMRGLRASDKEDRPVNVPLHHVKREERGDLH